MENIEKIEVQKANGNFFYTGVVVEVDGWVIIDTTRGEHLKFRREQIMMRKSVGDDSHGKGKESVKDL